MMPLRQTWPEETAARYRARGYWSGRTFPTLLREWCARSGEAAAVVGNGTRISYNQLLQCSEHIARGLLQLGLRPGERVVLQLPNIAEYVPTLFGLFLARLVPVFALPAHRSVEITHFLQRSEASAYIIAADHEGFDYRQLARDVQQKVPALRHVIVIGDAEEFCALDALEPGSAALPPPPLPSEVAFLQLSGGSTGLSKLIPRTHDDYIYSFIESAAICGLTADTVYLVALPVAHNFPMSSPGILGVLSAGGTIVMAPAPSPNICFPLIEKERVTMAALVPPLALLWVQAAASATDDLKSLRLLQVGGAKLLPETARRIKPALGCDLQQVFGMAEGLVCYTRLEDPDEIVLDTQGRPISPDDEIRIVDDDGMEVPAGEKGHLQTRGPYTIRAYHNDDAANANAFTADGFYRTGDIVSRSPQGYMVVHGRATDSVNRAGEKVSADEIENHLLAHSAIFDAAVVSLPDEYLGERSCAFLIAAGERPKAPELRRWMRERGIAAFKIPDQFVFVDAFETTAVGKISRRELRARLREKMMAPSTGEA